MTATGDQEIFKKVIEHDVQLKDLMGNGQPGRVKILEDNVQDLLSMKWKLAGFVVGLVFLMEGAHVGLKELLALLH